MRTERNKISLGTRVFAVRFMGSQASKRFLMDGEDRSDFADAQADNILAHVIVLILSCSDLTVRSKPFLGCWSTEGKNLCYVLLLCKVYHVQDLLFR